MTVPTSPGKTIFATRQRASGLLAALALVLFFGGALLAFGVLHERRISPAEYGLLCVSATGITLSVYLLYFVIPFSPRRKLWGWLAALASGLSIGLLSLVFPPALTDLLPILTLLATVLSAMIAGRSPAYAVIAIAGGINLWNDPPAAFSWSKTLALSPYLISFVLAETIVRLQDASKKHINRLETLNSFVRQISASIEIDQVISSLHIAIQRSLKADTYYVAFVKGQMLHLSMLYDDGEYFHDLEVPLENSLAGKVATSQKPLFLTNLLKEQKRTGITFTTVGKDKINLAWMGAPIQFGNGLVGVLAVASYRPAAFDEAEFDLLQNLARQASIALDNAHHHAESVQQSRLDSLTKAYNHGYFLELLNQQAVAAQQSNGVLSLIMLDIDQFKQYNDLYGHLVGDDVLVAMTASIQQNIKHTDAIGRWGGEEFAILLPHADGVQAGQVAARIRDTVRALEIHDRHGNLVPAPTISQGIAVFPLETEDIFRLVDLADQRLYIAKEHGRNQIEPPPTHWSHLQVQAPKHQPRPERP
ncbi:MAG: diguanylate cyclase [Anaerolineales bacterium]